MDNEWKNSLRERFSDYSAPEPEGLWEGIEQGIAGKPRRKMLPVWLISGTAVAAAVALVVFLHPDRTEETPVMKDQDRYAETVLPEVSPEQSFEPAVPVVEEEVSAPVPFAVASRHTLLSEVMPVETVSVPVFEETVPDAVHEIVPTIVPVEETPDQAELDDTVVTETKETEKTRETVEEALQNRVPSLQITPEPARRTRFSIGAYREGGQNATSEHSQGVGLDKTGAFLTRATHQGGQQKTSDLMNMLSNNRASDYHAVHAPPVRVGVSVAWELSPYLSLVSGVNWTSLNSHLNESTVGNTSTTTRQDLGYLGIPLRLEAGFEPLKRLRLYAGAGGMVEKGLMSKAETQSYIGNHLEETMTSHPDTGGLLCSVGASAGAEYRFSRFFGVYLAPGVEYHFDNGAEARSAYTEKPLHWNVALGVRFNFGK